MRLTTLNLRGFVDWDARLPRIAEYLRGVDPDVVLLQEVVYLPQVSAWTNADLLQRELAMPVSSAAVTRLQSDRNGAPYREGLAVLSKHPIPSAESVALLHAAQDPHFRIVQFVDVVAPDGVWRLGNVHLSVRDEYALTQAHEVLALLAARDELRVLAGDFNVNHLEHRAALWRDWTVSTDLDAYDSHPGTTETDDYVMAPPASPCRTCRSRATACPTTARRTGLGELRIVVAWARSPRRSDWSVLERRVRVGCGAALSLQRERVGAARSPRRRGTAGLRV